MCLRLVASDTLGGAGEAVAVQVQQFDPWLSAWKSAAIEEVARPHADIEVVAADVLIVEFEQLGRGALPDPAVGDPEHHEVVEFEGVAGVNGLAGVRAWTRHLQEPIETVDSLQV